MPKQQAPWDNELFASRFESLILLTSRPSIIRQLLDVPDLSNREIRLHAAEVTEKFGLDRTAAKGSPTAAESKGFLRKATERYHASVLYGIMTQAHLEASVTDGTYVEHVLEIYQRYLFITGGNKNASVISFETFVEVLSGFHRNVLTAMECKCCGAHHVVKTTSLVPEHRECPFCALHEHKPYSLSVFDQHTQSN